MVSPQYTWIVIHCCPSQLDHRCPAALLEIVSKDEFSGFVQQGAAPGGGLNGVFEVEHLDGGVIMMVQWRYS